MSEEKPSYTVIGKTDKSSIHVSDKGLKIDMSNKSLNPLGVITIIPGIQIELGRNIEEFIQCLKLIRQPLAIHKIADNKGQATWRILRLATGKVHEVIICTISTIKNVIASVSFNQELAYDLKYRKYQRLSAMHQLTAGRAGTIGLLSKAVIGISAITGEEASNFGIISNDKTIVVKSTLKKLENQYKFTFVCDKKGYFNLLSVGFMPKKS